MKTFYFLIAIVAAYIYLMINYPAEQLKPAVYYKLINVYGDLWANDIKPEIIYNPGLRKLDINLLNPIVYTVLPKNNDGYQKDMEHFLSSSAGVIVECSGLDTWHGSEAGSFYLDKIHNRSYRVVIFDGGHHLPTLGMDPDIIIVPQFRGYAAHGYMRDGMKMADLKDILEASQSPTVMVSVPRWSLVKTEGSLSGVSKTVIRQLSFRKDILEPFKPQCKPRLSKYHHTMYAYVNNAYAHDINQLIANIRSLGIEDVKTLYLAFDYSQLSPLQSQDYVTKLRTAFGLQVISVNEPVRVTDLLLKPQQD